MAPPERSINVVLAEIAEVRRHVLEAPPHHGGGREALEQRLRRLEIELARLRSGSTRGDAGSAHR